MNGMFNWSPPDSSGNQPIVSKNLWIYFAITVPLTAFILSGWLIFYYFFQKPQTMRNVTKIIHDLEHQLPPLPPKIPIAGAPIKGEKYL